MRVKFLNTLWYLVIFKITSKLPDNALKSIPTDIIISADSPEINSAPKSPSIGFLNTIKTTTKGNANPVIILVAFWISILISALLKRKY